MAWSASRNGCPRTVCARSYTPSFSKASAIHFATIMPIMLGTMNSSSPVSSNLITASEIVILETPAKNAPAPTMAKMPGEMEGTSWPIRRPKNAPPSKAGMMMPDGTLIPNVMMVRMSLANVPYTSHPIYLDFSAEFSCSHTQERLLPPPQSTSKFLIMMSPGSHVKGLGYWINAVANTTRKISKTGVVLDDVVLPECSRPPKVGLAEDASKNATCDTKHDEYDIMARLIRCGIVRFK